MILSRKLTGALAWGGLILILGVPSAEMLSAKVGNSPAIPGKTKPDPVQTASIAAPTGDAVTDFEASGQPMPDYISDPAPKPKRTLPATGTVAPAAAPKPMTTPTTAPTQTAALPAAAPEPAPIPMPVRMRPLPPAQPTQTAATQPTLPPPVSTPAVQQTPEPAPVIVDENGLLSREASAPPAIVPPADIPEPRVVSGDELEDWDSGSLADYLQRRGLMSDASYPAGQQSQSTAVYNDDEDDGFFLNDRPRRRAGAGDNDSFVVFPND